MLLVYQTRQHKQSLHCLSFVHCAVRTMNNQYGVHGLVKFCIVCMHCLYCFVGCGCIDIDLTNSDTVNNTIYCIG